MYHTKKNSPVLKRQGMTPKSIFKFDNQYLTFPFNKNHQICSKTKLLILILKVIIYSKFTIWGEDI